MDEPSEDAVIGRRIQDLRERTGLLQGELAGMMRAAGVNWSQGTLSRIESGARPVRLTEAPILADVLEVDIVALVSQTTPLAAELTNAIWNERAAADDIQSLKSKLLHSTWKYRSAKCYRQAVQLIDELSEGSTRQYVAHCSPPELWRRLTSRHRGEPHTTASEVCRALGLDTALVENSWTQFSKTASDWEESGQSIRALDGVLTYGGHVPFRDDAVAKTGRSNVAKRVAEVLRLNQLGKLMEDAYPNISWINDADSRPLEPGREELDLDRPFIEGLRELPKNAELQ